ncbi:ABC transporter substrate-binding protein [uncultured Maritimibacter sp.]|jgi:ABC-type nitrate/sulfonate/bicarbonate transport system substrate-binding protein|uniref:ABC transporter substrate-binding protein n=1 Tax=uncultured Maritimibacter sp. TaxID=991866 RepID=UPI000B161FAA|nr:ABC transporter substrate-binding protein [uncultured Maritimibacter sp.]
MTRPICTFLSGLACLAAPAAMADDVTIALDWTLNTNHIGLVVAQELGYFDDAGLEVEILPYSDSASTALLAAGVVDFAYMTALGFMSAKAADAPITALWVTMQHEAGRLVYNSDNPEITRPADLEGKTYAGFGSAWEDALITTMIENDGGTPDYDTVTLGTGAYEALASGAVDFTLEVATWEGVNSELLGREQSHFVYNDYGVPEPQGGYIGTRTETLADDPALVGAFMEATRQGYEWAAANPDEAAEILIRVGDFPNEELVRGSMRVIDEGGYLTDGSTPVGEIDTDRLTTMARFLYDSGVLTGPDGAPLAWPGDVTGWIDQSWRDQ